MNILEKCSKNQALIQRMFGFTEEQIETMTKRLRTLWKDAEIKRKMRENRRRKMGGGRQYKIRSMKERLLLILLYYKGYITQEFVGLLFNLHQSNVSRLLAKLRPLIEQAADPSLKTDLTEAKKESMQITTHEEWAEFLKKHPDLKDVSVDATEQQCFRSQDNETQKKHYSGKKKHHSIKVQIAVSTTGKVLDVSNTYPGSVHDKTMIDQEQTVTKFPEKTCQRFDLGYQGVAGDNPDYYTVLPFKKPKKKVLAPELKEANQMHSKRRVIVENVLSRIKKWKICSHLYRGPLKNHNKIFRSIVAFVNFRSAHPAAAM
jgi:hypothetical protein